MLSLTQWTHQTSNIPRKMSGENENVEYGRRRKTGLSTVSHFLNRKLSSRSAPNTSCKKHMSRDSYKHPTLPTFHLQCLPISRATRIKSSLDSGTLPQFGCNKGIAWSTLWACAFWLAALHIKQAGLSVSAQAAATKSESPALNTLRILALEFCTG